MICSFDESVIGFAFMPDAIGWDAVAQRPMRTIPVELRGCTYCTGCGAIYSRDGDYERGATQRMHGLMDGRWP